MIHGERVLGIIPARGGSKGVPGKNVRDAGGKPLLAWTIDAARGAESLDRFVLSSDDAAIIAAARAYGCEVPFVREAALAEDDTPSVDVVLDVIERCPGYDWIVLLQPTSPLRTAADIDGAVRRCMALQAPACVSVTRAAESPYWMFTAARDGRLAPLISLPAATRRQDLPAVYSLNGAVYVANTEWFRRERTFLTTETVAYEMPAERSLDIDTETDFQLLLTLLREHANASLSSPS